MIPRINELQHLFHLYTITSPPLELLVKPRGDKLSRAGNREKYQSFPTGKASPRYVVSVMKRPETYVVRFPFKDNESILPDLVQKATDYGYAINQCAEFFRRIEDDDDTLRIDRAMYATIQRNPTLKDLLPEEALFWQLLEMSKGKQLYETTFEAPEECFEAAKRYALDTARRICEEGGIIYDEKQERIGILRREEISGRKLVCVSASASIKVETDRWQWSPSNK